MEAWRDCWRRGVAPLLSMRGLEALRKGLVEDDVRLLQGATTEPPALNDERDQECAGACAIGYAGWQGDGLRTVGDVEDFFGTVCLVINQQMREDAAPCRLFTNWYDETERNEMRLALLTEVQRSLARRLSREDEDELLRGQVLTDAEWRERQRREREEVPS